LTFYKNIKWGSFTYTFPMTLFIFIFLNLFYVLDEYMESRKYIKINLLCSFIQNTLELLIYVIQQLEKFYQVLKSADFFSMCKNSILKKLLWSDEIICTHQLSLRTLSNEILIRDDCALCSRAVSTRGMPIHPRRRWGRALRIMEACAITNGCGNEDS